jgi:hypothetical protein
MQRTILVPKLMSVNKLVCALPFTLLHATLTLLGISKQSVVTNQARLMQECGK